MTCQECEIKLGMGEDASEHLASCEECRWLARELRLNSVALREMRVRPVMRWAWAVAAAAVIVMAIGMWKMPREAKLTVAPVRVAAAPPVFKAGHGPAPQKKIYRKRHTEEPLRVKLFTSDPDVVIYWIVDKKEGFE